MTDKEQIIEGADISKCFFSRYDENEKIYICDLMDFDEHYFNCDKNPNCYFKQLARKTQECEKYKKRAICFKDVNKQLGYKYLTIKQEFEGLKERLDRTEEDLKYQCVDCMNCQSDRYRKALEEIEKFTKKHCDFWCEGNRILDIINKAKGEGKCQ